MRKIISWMLIVVICFSVCPTVFAARDTSYEETLAKCLKNLGIFQGVSDTDFALHRAPTRAEALTMLVRILGKEKEAQKGGYDHPFTDVPDWADNYVGYAYENGLTKGTSATTFGTEDASAQMYLTFVFRALGYLEGSQFTWDNPWELALKLNMPIVADGFLRADIVTVSYVALNTKTMVPSGDGGYRNGPILAEKLIEEGVFTKAAFNKYYDPNAMKEYKIVYREMTAEEIYNECSPAVFYMEVYNRDGYATGSGSGFFLNQSGIAVTNYHVIEGCASAIITHSVTQKEYKVLGVYDYDVKNDWAIIQVEGSGFDYLNIGQKSSVVGGATVYAIGSPMGLQNTISQGLISNTNRVLDGTTYIQTSAAISHGSSGGALINKYGDVIGITAAGFTDGENLGLAIPASAISGYKTEKITSLSTLFGNQGAGNQNTDPSAGKYTAEEVLAAFIRLYQNEQINDSIAFTITDENENGIIEYSACLSPDGELSMIVWVDYGTMTCYFSIDLNTPDYKFLIFTSESNQGDTLIGYANLNAATVRKDMPVTFEKVEGNGDVKTAEELASVMLGTALDEANAIFQIISEKTELGNFSVADFGFVHYR